MLRRKILLFTVIAFIFSSCGIDDIVYLEPPKLIHSPSEHTDESLKYFEFETSDKDNLNIAPGFFKGFEVYYRIYESKDDCENVIKHMAQYAESNPSNSVNHLLFSYNYKFLSHSNHSYQNRPIIKALSPPPPPNDRRVRFRIEHADSLPNKFILNGVEEGETRRQNSEDFANAKRGDYDVQSSGSASTDSFYVSLFAAAYGSDTTFKPVYSNLISLGYVTIKKNTLISP